MTKNFFKILIFSTILAITASQSLIALAALDADYVLLEPQVVNQAPGSTIDFGKYAQELFKKAFLVAVSLAVFMLVLSGVYYIVSYAPGALSEAKSMWTNALWGLAIAICAYALLYTINPNLVEFNFNLTRTPASSSIFGNSQGSTGIVPANNGNFDHNLFALSGPRMNNETNAQAILRNAQFAANNRSSTCNISGTNGGRLACAATVNSIVEVATGQAVGGGLSTANMYPVLQNSNRFTPVSGGINGAQPGDIIIAPTSGGNTGHVGICETAGCGSIISNQSGSATVGRNPGSYWANQYRNLQIYVFRPLN